MTAPIILLGECTICGRHVFRRGDHPDTPEWFRPAAKGPLKPHRHADNRIGRCTLCMSTVHLRGDGAQVVKKNGRLSEHTHAKPFEVIPESRALIPVRDDGPEEYRYWHDQVPGFARPFG